VTVIPNPGSWAERINVPTEVAVAVPDSISDAVRHVNRPGKTGMVIVKT
jgi:hypothetical protein